MGLSAGQRVTRTSADERMDDGLEAGGATERAELDVGRVLALADRASDDDDLFNFAFFDGFHVSLPCLLHFVWFCN